jgi:hypothetical protein
MADEKVDTIAEKPAGDSEKDKRIQELEQKLGEMGKQLGDQEEFVKQANIVANVIAYNPELKDHFRRVYTGEGVGEQQEEIKEEKTVVGNKPTKDEEVDRRIKGVEESERGRIIREFETRYGIDSMTPEAAKVTRQKIEGFLNEFGSSITSAPLTSLSSNLDKAFLATHAEKLKEEGKLEGFVQMRTNDLATLPRVHGGSLNEDEKPKLTDGQIKWAGKLGVPLEKAVKSLEELTKEKEGKTE